MKSAWRRPFVFIWSGILAVRWCVPPTLYTRGSCSICGHGRLDLRCRGDVTRFRTVSPLFRRPALFITVPWVFSHLPLSPLGYRCLCFYEFSHDIHRKLGFVKRHLLPWVLLWLVLALCLLPPILPMLTEVLRVGGAHFIAMWWLLIVKYLVRCLLERISALTAWIF